MNADDVSTREDAIRFMNNLAESVTETPDAWENGDLQSFLLALAAWTHDMDGYFINFGLPVPRELSWTLLAQMLSAAQIYE